MTDDIDVIIPKTTAGRVELAKWEITARDRIKAALPIVMKELKKLDAADAVEANTRIVVTEILTQALGYDKFDELTAEYLVKGDFADIGLRINKQIVAFVEIKRIKQQLKSAHLRQVESYALRDGVDWAILTNGREWQVYHVRPRKNEQSELTMVFGVDLLNDETRPSEKRDLLFFISREGLSKGRLETLWKTKEAASPETLRAILLSEPVLNQIRLQVRQHKKQNLELHEIKAAIEGLLKN